MNTSLRALNRFGLGARPGEAQRLSDPRGWLADQLNGGAPLLAPPTVDDSVAEIVAAQRVAARTDDPDGQRRVRRRIRALALGDATAAMRARLTSDRPFVERWVAFWSNHLCVSGAAKLPTRLLSGAYEREAIRPHVLGRFEDLVLASARHPAMLTYLDNAQSIGPESTLARLAGRRRRRSADERPPIGLNENYARELLELHTLGVNGGYTEADIREAARVLTGWTVTGLRAPGRPTERGDEVDFVFEARIHEPGAKTVLDQRYDQGGADEGETMIRDLCRHPSTARFLAKKLATHFVSDQPPASSVDRIAEVFRATRGDLHQVARAVIELPEAWDPDHRKFRTPHDWAVAMLRVVGTDDVPASLFSILQDLRQPLWAPPSPKGYGDTMSEWADPDSLMNRAELARTVSTTVVGRGGGRSRAVAELAGVVERADDDPFPALVADETIPIDERVALGFADPAFQWR